MAGDDIDHLLTRQLDPSALPRRQAEALFLAPEPHPFLRYRRLCHGYLLARAAGVRDGAYLTLVRELDAAVAGVDGRGFRETPFAPADELARHLGLGPERLWIKDETGNVSGSHKARHLFGLLLWLEVARRRSGETAAMLVGKRLAIASCGNAALAAAVVARAAGWPLDVYVPPDAHPNVLARLAASGAHLTPCPRTAGVAGDPCFHRFRQAVAAGALPFTCQGSENALVIEGGKTLGWEIVSGLLAAGRDLDRLFLQVGGGALASATIQAFGEARDLGLLSRLPRIHAVQTTGASPLHRAWRRLGEHLLSEAGGAIPETDRELAHRLGELPEAARQGGLRHAATHRSRYMWPWEEEPRSLATGILDDETYDWLAVVGGMLATGGHPLVVTEEQLARAHHLAREHTPIPADPTGTSGLAGLVQLAETGAIGRDEAVAVLLTGVER